MGVINPTQYTYRLRLRLLTTHSLCNCNRHSQPPSARHVVLGSVQLHKQVPTLSSWDACECVRGRPPAPPSTSDRQPLCRWPLAAGRSIALVTLAARPWARQCVASGTTRFAWVTQRGHPDPVGHCRRLTWRQFPSCLDEIALNLTPATGYGEGGQLEGKNLIEHAAALGRLASQPVTLLLA